MSIQPRCHVAELAFLQSCVQMSLLNACLVNYSSLLVNLSFSVLFSVAELILNITLVKLCWNAQVWMDWTAGPVYLVCQV